jgi:hypothetical protein
MNSDKILEYRHTQANANCEHENVFTKLMEVMESEWHILKLELLNGDFSNFPALNMKGPGEERVKSIFIHFSVFAAIWWPKVCIFQQHRQNLEERIRFKVTTNFRIDFPVYGFKV